MSQSSSSLRRRPQSSHPRLFRNMRASRVTDWAEALPSLMVAKWLGHGPLVAANHYLQTRNAHFEVAFRGEARAEPLRGSEA